MKGLMGHLNRQGRSVSAPVFLVLMLVLLALAACSPPTPQLTRVRRRVSECQGDVRPRALRQGDRD